MKPTQTKPSIVFCHGIWADGSCFNKVIPTLQADGHQVIAAQYGLDSLASDVATVKRTLGRVSSPAILVGHSYGGSVITAAGADDRVVGLVYIAALAPDADETSQGQQDKFPRTDVFSYVEVADGRAWMLPRGVECFAGDLSEQEKEVVWATHFAPAADIFNHREPEPAWRVEELAKKVAMSRTSFALRFKTIVGVAPLTYLMNLRMQFAEQGLREVHMSISELGFSLGYATESAFSNAFKRTTGMAPKRYRNVFANMDRSTTRQ